VILLDTNAVIWLLLGHRRAAPLLSTGSRLFLSPVSLLELQFLIEVGRLREPSDGLSSLTSDPRWNLDSPSSDVLFRAALNVGWTRDPFDRLLIAHARCRRLQFATGDRFLIENLPEAMLL
jgi:PIN domain nuclease of toxin-antitoxin system